jgi:hypothetical protein
MADIFLTYSDPRKGSFYEQLWNGIFIQSQLNSQMWTVAYIDGKS